MGSDYIRVKWMGSLRAGLPHVVRKASKNFHDPRKGDLAKRRGSMVVLCGVLPQKRLPEGPVGWKRHALVSQGQGDTQLQGEP